MQAPSRPSPPALSEQYYLDNFRELLAHVERQYEDLLPADLRLFLQNFQNLPEVGQRLLVRLLMRKGRLFRVNKLAYADIADTAEAMQLLITHGFVRGNPCAPIEQWLELFTKQQWLAILTAHALRLNLSVDALTSSLRKAELHDIIKEAFQGAEVTPSAVIDEPVVELAVQESFDVFKLLYFGNARQDLSEFVLRDLQVQRYEPYALGRASRLFESWAQVESHRHFYALQQTFPECDSPQALQDLAQALLAIETDRDPRLQRRVTALLLTIARELERMEAAHGALGLYQACFNVPPARERAARLLVTLNLPDQALALCKTIVNAPLDDQELAFAQAFGHRTAAKTSLSYWPKYHPYQPTTEQWGLVKTQGDWGDRLPEWAVASELNRSGVAYYVENALFLGIFSLLYWPVFFAPVAGAFSHPFQSKPHDLNWPSFRSKRLNLIEEIESQWQRQGDYFAAQPIIDLWLEKQGTQHSLIQWSRISEPLLRTALARIPIRHWREIFNYLWADLANRRRGLPDLIYFADAGGYELIEVKGPGDKLQGQQRHWLAFFARYDMPHRVINVVWQD